MKKSKNPYLSIPNILSYFRILLLPILIWLQFSPQSSSTVCWSGLIILASGISDVLDGYIARKYDQITEFGKIIDPLADKLTQLALMICLYFKHPVIVPLLFLFLFKELYTAVFSTILLRRGVKINGAKWYGKVATAVFYIAMIIIFFHPKISPLLLNILVGTTLAFMALAFILYVRLMYLMWEESKNNPKQSVKDQVSIITKNPGLPVTQKLRRSNNESSKKQLKLPKEKNGSSQFSGKIYMLHNSRQEEKTSHKHKQVSNACANDLKKDVKPNRDNSDIKDKDNSDIKDNIVKMDYKENSAAPLEFHIVRRNFTRTAFRKLLERAKNKSNGKIK